MRRTATVLLLVLAPALLGAAPPQDPLVGQQLHLPTVRAFEAWDVRRGEGAIVAVLDTGVDLDHPDLDGRLVEGIDLIEPGTPPDDPQGHGTIVAGIIAAVANNNRGVAGVAPRAQVMPIRVLDAQGRGTSDIVAEGIRRAIEAEVDVINLSLAEVQPDDGDDDEGGAGGGSSGSGSSGGSEGSGGVAPPFLPGVSLVEDEEVVDAIQQADDAGILVVAAAGNDGRSSTPYDQDSPVIVVGATDEDGYVWTESNRDDRTLFAPGVRILSTWSEGRYARSNGTSFATPIVSAGAAMLMGAGLELDEVRERLVSTAIPVGDPPPPEPDAPSAEETAEPTPSPTPTPTAPPPPPVEPGDEVGLGRIDLAAAVEGVEPAPTPSETPAPPPADTDAEPEPEPVDVAPDGSTVEEPSSSGAPGPTAPAADAPATVTEAPPPIEAGAEDLGDNPLAVVPTSPSPGTRVDLEDADPVEIPDDVAGIAVDADGKDPTQQEREAAATVATMLIGANLAGIILVRRQQG